MKKHFTQPMILGVLLVAVLAGIAYFIAKIPTIKDLGISPLIIGIVLGMALTHTPASKIIHKWKEGVIFSAKKILRFAIIFYGFNLTFQLIASVGLDGLSVSVIMLVSTLILGIVLGTKIFSLDRDSSILVAAGSGVSAHAEEVAVTVKMIRVMMLAPMLIVIGIWIAKSATTVTGANGSKPEKGSIKKIIP